MTDDTSLLQRYAFENAEDAFRELVRRHVDGVYSAALRRSGGNSGLAEDVTQKVFVALARKARTLTRHPYLTAWLHTVTRLETISALRSEGRRRGREQEAYAMQEMMSDGEGTVEWSRLAPVLDSAIDSLKEADRAAVLLRFVDQRGFAEIGATLGISEDAARMRVNRALESLRVVLTRRGISSTSAALGLALAGNAVVAAPAELAGTAAATALAVVGTGTGVTAAALGFMSTTKFMAVASGLALLAAGTATWQVGEARAAQRELEQSRAETLVGARQLRKVEAEASAAEEKVAALRKAVADAKQDEAARLQSATWATRTAEEKKALGKQFVEKHPELVDAGTEMARANYWDMLRGYATARNLSDAQIRDLVRYLRGARPMSIDMDLGALGPANVELARGETDTSRPSWFSELERQHVKDSLLLRHSDTLVDRVARELCFTETPLTSQQADQLRVAAAHAPPSGSIYDWPAVYASDLSAFSPRQLEALKTVELSQRYLVAASDAITAAKKAGTANATSSK